MSDPMPLPVKWDGVPVEWGPWEPATDVFICPPPKPTPCLECGLIRPRSMATGTVTLHVDLPTIGRPRLGPIRRMLRAFRCTACGHDTVIDWETQVWELDMTDYGPDGSWSVEGGKRP